MPRWLRAVLKRIRARGATRRVVFTLKARRELASLGLGLDPTDACDVLARLTADDSAGRVASATTAEWLYLFKPTLHATTLYVKVILRNDCVVVSFHENEGDAQAERK